MTQSASLKRSSTILALLFATSLITTVFVVSSIPAFAQTAVSQCNSSDNVGGQAVECHYTITNNLNGSVTSSTVASTRCHGAANAPATMACTSSTATSTDLVTSIDQCNGSGSGGGGTVDCTVDVINNVTGATTATATTVNQCNTSGTGGGTAPTTACDPSSSNTAGAAVTQCNGSGNGGGGTQRVRCTVDSGSTSTTLLTVTINQCNGSGNGGGSTVNCRTGISTNITAPTTSPSTSPSPSPTPSPSPGPGGNGGGSSGKSVHIRKIVVRGKGAENGSNASLNRETVVIANRGTSRVVMTGWTLRDRSGHVFRFPTFILRAGGRVRIYTGRGSNNTANLFWNSHGYVWNNDGDRASLRSRNKSPRDRCTYSGSGRIAHC
jgi:hypothetical protein